MKLNEQQRALLEMARDVIAKGYDRYICFSVERVSEKFTFEPKSVTELLDSINAAVTIHPSELCATFDRWFAYETGFYCHSDFDFGLEPAARLSKRPAQLFDVKSFECLARMARVAWIDRILDEGEVK